MKDHNHNYLIEDAALVGNERRTLYVVLLTATMMAVEIFAGWLTGSMALLADGWHMASHAGALGIAYFAYRLAKAPNLSQRFSFGAGKFIPLGGYTSAIMLGIVAVFMGAQSVARLFAPIAIHFNEALIVATAGLGVNIVSAIILGWKQHHDHGYEEVSHHHHGNDHHHDHNLRAAYLHVVADALTSVFAIIALIAGKFFGWLWLDAMMGIVGGLIILKWAVGLARKTAWELLDGHARQIDAQAIRTRLESEGAVVGDLHVWRIAPRAHACEIILYSKTLRGGAYYQHILRESFDIQHLIIEERAA